jgi:EAL domain-containing protein (putative c-di-GMP-specific phosphodiesterase class I)
MYEAKENGGDGYSFFASGVTSAPRIKARIEWVDRIATALESGRFVLLVQPIVDLQGGHVTQYELLLRMRDDEGGLIAPAAFLSVAERYGMISRIDRWVVERAVEILDTHERAGIRSASK